MYYILRLINIFLTLIPRKIGLKLGQFLGFLIYHLSPVRKKIAKKNISLSFPDLTNDKREKMIKDCYKHFGMVLIDFLRMPMLNKKNIKTIILESENNIGSINSSRNTEVIHAGIYYRINSLKGQLCKKGKHELYDFCLKYDVKCNVYFNPHAMVQSNSRLRT